MIKVYHNPRCSKSRAGLEFLSSHTTDFKIINYIKNPLSEEELTQLISYLQIPPLALVRTKEAIWKDKFKGKTLTDQQIINAMVTYPQLIERPIVVNGSKAVIARPVDKIAQIL